MIGDINSYIRLFTQCSSLFVNDFMRRNLIRTFFLLGIHLVSLYLGQLGVIGLGNIMKLLKAFPLSCVCMMLAHINR